MSTRYALTARVPGFLLTGPYLGDWFLPHDRIQRSPFEWTNELGANKTNGGTIRSFTFSTLGVEATPVNDLLLCRYITPALDAQTISGTINVCLTVLALRTGDGADTDARYHLHVYATKGSTNEVRAVLLDNYRDSGTIWSWFSSVFRSLDSAQALVETDIEAGDRIVVEIGATLGAPGDASIKFYTGCANGSGVAAADGVAGVADVSKAGWVEFSADLVEADLPAAPAYDTSATAEVIASLPYDSGVIDASQAALHTVWYTWTADRDGEILVHTLGANYGTALTIRQDSSTGTVVASGTARIWGGRSQMITRFTAVSGTVYYFSAVASAVADDYGAVCADTGGAFRLQLVSAQPLTSGDIIVSCQHITRYTAAGALAAADTGLYGYTPVGQAIDYTGRPLVDFNSDDPNTNPRVYVAMFDTAPWVEILDLTRLGPTDEVDFIIDPFNLPASTSQNLCSIIFDQSGRVILGYFGDHYDVVGLTGSAGTFKVERIDGTHADDQPDAPFAAPENFDVAQDVGGSDFVELATDQHTLYYTSSGRKIKVYDLDTATQLADFAELDPSTDIRPGLRSIRLLPAGGMLACDGATVKRLDAAGAVIATYTPTGDDAPYTSLDKVEITPGQDAFWVSDQLATTLFKFDLASGLQTDTIKTLLPRGQLCGFSIYKGYRAGELVGPEDETTLSGSPGLVTVSKLDGVAAAGFLIHPVLGADAQMVGGGIVSLITGAMFDVTLPSSYDESLILPVAGGFAVTIPPPILPCEIIDIRRVVWVPHDATEPSQLLYREDEEAINAYLKGWQTALDQPPVAYSLTVMPARITRFAPQTSLVGTLDLLIYPIPVNLSALDNTELIISEDYGWIIVWGALADLLSEEGPAQDLQRAAYALQRWTDGCQIARVTSAALQVWIDTIPHIPDALIDLHQTDPGWMNVSGEPDTPLVSGWNLLGLSPVPDAVYPITVDLIHTVPAPVSDNDLLGIPCELFDTILNYAAHVAAFKQGAAQVNATQSGYTELVKMAMLYNERVRARGVFADILGRQKMEREWAKRPRRATPPSADLGTAGTEGSV